MTVIPFYSSNEAIRYKVHEHMQFHIKLVWSWVFQGGIVKLTSPFQVISDIVLQLARLNKKTKTLRAATVPHSPLQNRVADGKSTRCAESVHRIQAIPLRRPPGIALTISDTPLESTLARCSCLLVYLALFTSIPGVNNRCITMGIGMT